MYLQQKQAAAALKMSRQWLWHLINEGEITVAEIAGVKFVVDDARFKAIQRQRVKAKP